MTKKKQSAAVAKVDAPTVPINTENPSHLLALAVQNNLDVDKLERLMGLQERFIERRARESFYEAMSNFQYECPSIKRTKKVSYHKRDSTDKIEYSYAPLDSVEQQIKQALMKNGLSYRWEISERMEKDQPMLNVTCKITHKDGHSESTVMSGGLDASGSKNAIQSRGSTITYLKRYTLLGALGIGSADSDVDGRGPSPAVSGAVVDAEVVHLPPIPADRYKASLGAVQKGTVTVADIEKRYSLSEDQRNALLVAQQNSPAK